MTNSFSRYLLLIILFFLYSCSDNGWSKEKKDFIKIECIENAKNKILDENYLNEICSCVSGEFTTNFSWAEYQTMLNSSVTNESNPDLNNKLELYIGSVIEECQISF